MKATELAVIGAGPAGLAASTAAATAGVAVTLIDEYPRAGGQYLKPTSLQIAAGAPLPPPLSATEQQARALLCELPSLRVMVYTGTLVYHVAQSGEAEGSGQKTGPPQRTLGTTPGDDAGLRLALYGPDRAEQLTARAVVVATGARELVVPFPGWTLPGVMTLGAAHLLMKEHGVLPGRRVLLAGSGPLLYPVLHELLGRSAEVAGVLEASHLSAWPRHGPALWGQWDRLREGWTYVKDLVRARVPYCTGHTVVRALGDQQLEAAVVARLDRGGKPVSRSEEMIPVDALCVGFGFVPNTDLTQLAGCVHEFDATRGGWVVRVNQRLETSIPGLFAAGEVTGVDGAGPAMLEGRLAGLAAAQRLGSIRMDELERELAALAPARRRYRRFGRMLNTLFAPRPGLAALTTPDTVICRCEEVTAGEVLEAVRNGVRELDALKTWTRVGQGPCQGRTCGPLLARLVARETGRDASGVGTFHVRPPLKPVPLGALAGEDER